MYAKNELMFPSYVIPTLRDGRGDTWCELVERVEKLPETHPERLAFVLMMIRLDGCMECETDSYRAMRGCGMCASQTLRRYKGSDQDLLDAYAGALGDVESFLETRRPSVKVA